MFSVSCLCVMATGLLCNSMLPVVSFLYFCMFVNFYANNKKRTGRFCLQFKRRSSKILLARYIEKSFKQREFEFILKRNSNISIHIKTLYR